MLAETPRSEGDPSPPTRSLAQALRGSDNALNFLRLMLAFLVIVDHAFPLAGIGADPMWRWSKGQDSMGGIAVSGFFAISGFLITRSARQGDVVQFLWRRALRIFPGYWTILLVTAFVVAPILWRLEHRPSAQLFATDLCSPQNYFRENWTLEVGRYCIKDLLRSTTPYGRSIDESAFNGSLWTLIYEWRCYLLVAFVSLGGLTRRLRAGYAFVAALGYVFLVVSTMKPELATASIAWLDDVNAIHFASIFLLGGVLALYADEVPVDDRLGMLTGAVFYLTLTRGGYYVLGYPAFAYFVLWLGARLPAVFRRIGAKADYSYGVYLYGFLVEQVMAYAGLHRLGLAAYTLIAIVLSYGLGALSWHLVEEPALRLKSRGPGRGVSYFWQLARARMGRATPST